MNDGSSDRSSAVSLDRSEQLLIDSLLNGLDDSQLDEFDDLGLSDDDALVEYGQIVAGLQRLGVGKGQALPDSLRRQLLRDVNVEPSMHSAPKPQSAGIGEGSADRRLTFAWAGWLVAAIAVAALVVSTLVPFNSPSVENIVERDPVAPQLDLQEPMIPPDLSPVVPSASEQLASIQAIPGTISLNFTRGEDEAARDAIGSVVWNNAEQAGFMKFAGLPVNDPSEFQYQLWIFDSERDEKYPVDGGVFDIADSGETLVPIAAKLNVSNPTLFAITIEQPGGVVVSSRKRLPLLAVVPEA